MGVMVRKVRRRQIWCDLSHRQSMKDKKEREQITSSEKKPLDSDDRTEVGGER